MEYADFLQKNSHTWIISNIFYIVILVTMEAENDAIQHQSISIPTADWGQLTLGHNSQSEFHIFVHIKLNILPVSLVHQSSQVLK